MKKILLLMTLCLCATLISTAQTQHGIVRTLEKPNRPSVGIEGATVSIQYQNDVISKKGGKFTISMHNKKLGDSFKVTRVQKEGYTLVDKMLQGRIFAYSSSVPIEIVMVSNKQLANDKKRIEDKAYAKAKNTYESKIAALERQLKEKSISEQAYYKERERLCDNYDEYLKLIDEMAERYAMTDYKGLSDLNRQIMECIENAELERADSLINSKGDFDKRERELREQMELNQAITEYLEKSEQDAKFKFNDLAQDYYNKFTILASNFQNDSAAFYLERLAELDTTNFQWQNMAGHFIDDYIANYSLALKYFKRGLHQALVQEGEESEWVTTFYGNIGNVYAELNEYAQAMEYQQRSLAIIERFLGSDHPFVATFFNNIGLVCIHQGEYAQALEYFQKALSIIECVLGPDSPDVATFYNNIGDVYSRLGDNTKALEYQHKAIDIEERTLGTENPDVATSYNNIGLVYLRQGDYARALEYHQKALAIWERILGPEHPNVARSYNNIGMVYSAQGDSARALKYYQKAIDLWERVVGPEHPDVAAANNNIGVVYDIQGDYAQALEYYLKALTIRERVLGIEHPDIAESYSNIGYVYFHQEDYERALEYFHKSLSILEHVFSPDHPNVTMYYNIIGLIYYKLKDYTRALEYYQKALDILEHVFGHDHLDVAMSCNDIGEVYIHLGNSDRALEYYQKALDILERVLGPNHPDVATSYNNIGIIFYTRGDYSKGLEYGQKALNIFERALGTEAPQTVQIRSVITIVQYQLALELGEINNFNLNHCLIATIVDDNTPAKQQGMEGEYVLLEYNDWLENSPVSLFDKNAEYKGKPKDIVVLKDGVISKHHFEDVMGVQLGVKEITKEERERINQLYKTWKRDQALLDVWNSRKKDNSVNKQSD